MTEYKWIIQLTEVKDTTDDLFPMIKAELVGWHNWSEEGSPPLPRAGDEYLLVVDED